MATKCMYNTKNKADERLFKSPMNSKIGFGVWSVCIWVVSCERCPEMLESLDGNLLERNMLVNGFARGEGLRLPGGPFGRGTVAAYVDTHSHTRIHNTHRSISGVFRYV